MKWYDNIKQCNVWHNLHTNSILRNYTHAVFRLTLPINLTSPFHHFTQDCSSVWNVVTYRQYVTLPSVTPILDDAYFSQQKESTTNLSQVTWTEVFNHVKNYRRHSKGLMDCEMVLRHHTPNTLSFPNKWSKWYKILSQNLQPYNLINKSSECERWSTILRSSVIILMIWSIPNVWIKPCQPS